MIGISREGLKINADDERYILFKPIIERKQDDLIVWPEPERLVLHGTIGIRLA